MSTKDLLKSFESGLVGRSCFAVRHDYSWTFDLQDGVFISVTAPWRIVLDGRIHFSSMDDGQMFGRSFPVNGEAEARKLLENKSITRAMLDRQTADLTLFFDRSTRIDVFNNSVGYEGWQATYKIDAKLWSLIALGGGDIAFCAQ